MTSGERTMVGHVLVIEDNPGDARLVEFYLKEDPTTAFAVRKAGLLREALEILASQPFDVVLLDLSLPDSFGLEGLEQLRRLHPLIPVVVLTGTNDEGLALSALRQGAQDYLIKGQGDGELVRRAIHYAIERSRVGLALLRSEARFRALFESAGVGVVLTEPGGRFVEANPAFRAMVGYADEELRRMSFHDLAHPEDVAENDALGADLQAGTREGFKLTKRYLTKDGGVVWARVTVTAVREDGVMRFAVAVVEDITERKRLEDHQRLAAEIFQHAGEGLFVTDVDHRIVMVNPAFTEITGYRPEEVMGQTPKVLASGRHDRTFYDRISTSLAETGKWQGEIWNRRKSGEMYAEWLSIGAVKNADGLVTNYVAVFTDITSRKQVEERLSYQANHDPLTRLPNRTLFNERLTRALARAQRNRSMVALLFVDLDRFKQVNDTLGHLAGDTLLQLVAERLTGSTRQGDTVARLGGDEFTIIIEDIGDPRDAAQVAHKVLHVMAQPFDLSGEAAEISSSVGVALYPVDAGDAQTLIKLADGAMYRAKHLGRNNCQFHSEAVNAQAFERLALETGLRHALERDEFELLYQPIFDARSGRVVSVEALLRWRHPDVGMVAPKQFLPLAEETGLIIPIGRWALAAACRQVRAWRDMGFRQLGLNVNLSGRQLRQTDLTEMVAEALEGTELPPTALELEIPESCVMDKGHDAGGVLTRFKALGVGLAIDEFGAGYSSFAFLRRLPSNALKVAQNFVHDASISNDDAEIISAIVAVARGLHMTVIAPGIETEDQLAFLIGHGCDRVQGFLLTRPMPADECEAFLRRGEVPEPLAKGIAAT